MSHATLAAASDPIRATPVPDPMLDAGQVAQLFAVKRYTVLQWAKSGRLPRPVRIGNTIRWPRSTIATLMAGD